MGFRIKGWFAVCLVLIITYLLYFLSKPSGFDPFRFPLNTLAQMLGLTGAVLLSLNYVLSARIPVVEKYLGGLDKVYKFHHTIGTSAFVTMMAHPLSMVIRAFPNREVAAVYLIYGTEFAYNMGILAIYSFILILLFTFIIKLPYQHWLKTHQLLGIPLLLAFIHTLYIESDISEFLPLRLWITAFFLLGLISYVYKVFLYDNIGPKYTFTISRLKLLDNILEIYLEPISSALSFLPGQFVFVSFPSLSHESHPFSISSSPQDPHLRLSIKVLGDYTSTLKNLRSGMVATLTGPYGRFFKPFLSGKPLIIAAGGIGITPFLGMLAYEADNPTLRPIKLYYSVTAAEDAVYLEELEALAAKNKNITIHPHYTKESGYLTANILAKDVSDYKNYYFLLCGPTGFMDSLSAQLVQKGVNTGRIYYEDFSLNLS